MKKLSIWSAVKVGWDGFAKRPWYLLGLTMAAMFLLVLATGDMLVTAFASVIYGGYLIILFKHYRGEWVKFDDLFSIDRQWISLTAVILIKAVLVGLGFLLFVVPGFYLATRWLLAEYLVIDQNLTPLAALRESSNLTQGYRWKLFFYIILTIILVVLGVLALIVGTFVAVAVINLATIDLYHRLQVIKSTSAEPVTSADTA